MQSLPLEPQLLLKQTELLLKQILNADAEIAESVNLTRKHDYTVLRVKMRYPAIELVLKLGGPAASIACPFEQTAFLHQLVSARTTIFMPKVLAADSTDQILPWRYLIRIDVPGEEWAHVRDRLSAEEEADAHAQIGDAVAQLHNISLPAFGEFAPNGHVRAGRTYLQALQERIESTIQSRKQRALFLFVLEQNANLFVDVGDAALCHDDLHKHNLLFRQVGGKWRLATVLDFDKAWAGCPESDLARLELWDGMTSDSFWRAYRARRAISPKYEQRRPIFQLLWCLEYAKGTKKHLADTNRLCTILRLPTIDHFD